MVSNIYELEPVMIVVHGDEVNINSNIWSQNNILVAHIEGEKFLVP